MKKYRFEFILFVVDAICMILELIASRILSPYFGNSNFVWTSVIGIILLSSSIGNYCGGIIADRKDTLKRLKLILLAASIYIFIIPLVQKPILDLVLNMFLDIKLGAILATILLFFIPSVLMGLITPIIVKLKLEDLDTAGYVSGRMNSIATIGGITGTFLGGFFLVPNVGSVELLFVLTILVLLMVPFVEFKLKSKSNIFVFIMILISIFFLYKFSLSTSYSSEKVLNGEYNTPYYFDTQYGRVSIYNRKVYIGNEEFRDVRFLNIDGGHESASYVDEEYMYELFFTYTKYYDLAFKANIDVKDTLMIGGAGYSYPKYYISHFPDKNMDVVEIDGKITDIAKKFFFLDKLWEDYDLEKNKRLSLYTEDGRTYLNNNKKKYDAIMNDSFAGLVPSKELTTLEALKLVKKSLNKNGVYLTNIIGSFEGDASRFLKAEVNTLKQVFKYVYVVLCDDVKSKNTFNNMVIASDDKLNLNNTYDLDISKDEIILTDNYCPVDDLISDI